MTLPEGGHLCWIAVMDNRWARLVRCQRNSGGRWHGEEVETLRSGWEQHHERHDPALPDRTPRPAVPERAPGWAHKKEEETKRFTHEIASWLEKRAHEHAMHELWVFAPDHFLGPLRASWSAKLRPIIRDHAADLTHLSAAELTEHPAIAPMLRASAAV